MAVAAAIALAPGIAGADPLTDAEVSRRIAWIARRLDRGTAASDRWWYAWYAGFTATTAAQALVATATTDPGLRADMAVGALGTSLGVVPLGLFPFEPRFAAADLSRIPGPTATARLHKLEVAERLLRESAEAEAFGRSWIAHALGVGVSLGLGLVLALSYDRPVSGLLNFAGGVAITELQIFTQPTDAIDALREYRAAHRWAGPGLGARF